MKILKAVVAHWKHDWNTNRPLFWIELVGAIASIAGTVTLSVFIKATPLLMAYMFWLCGSTLIMLGAYLRGASWLFVLMFFNTIMNIVGLVLLAL